MAALGALEGRVVLITHVRHFAGPAAARAMAEAGAVVVCHDESFADVSERDAFVAETGHAVTDRLAPDEIVGDVTETHGRIDVVVNNDAFPAIRAPVEDAKIDDMRDGLEAMVVAPFALAKAVTPQMKARRAGKILFVTSATPLRGLANYSMYVTARGAANALAVTLAKELARDNIQVNAVAPNYVESPDYFPPELLDDPKTRDKILANIPLGRLGKPEELAALIAFLASDKADFITGQVIPFAGGWA